MIRIATGFVLGLALLAGTSALAAENAPATSTPQATVAALAAPTAVTPAPIPSLQKTAKACPTAPQSLFNTSLADELSPVIEQESTIQRLPKICAVDCTPCNTAADCIIGGCKAIQCP